MLITECTCNAHAMHVLIPYCTHAQYSTLRQTKMHACSVPQPDGRRKTDFNNILRGPRHTVREWQSITGSCTYLVLFCISWYRYSTAMYIYRYRYRLRHSAKTNSAVIHPLDGITPESVGAPVPYYQYIQYVVPAVYYRQSLPVPVQYYRYCLCTHTLK